MKILIPLDGSKLGESILTHVRPLVDRASEVHLLRVLQSPAEAASANDALESARAALGVGGEAARVHVTQGKPAQSIVDLAAKLQIDLIAMASHGRSGVTRLLRGSVAEEVLQLATVPVYLFNPTSLTTHPGTERFPRILVALDGSKQAASILPLVGRLAGAWKADVVLLHVDVPGEVGVSATPEVARLQAQGHADMRLAPVQEAMLASEIRSRIVGLHGDPAACIVDAVAKHDVTLVAMTTHGRTGLNRLQFGSVAAEVLRRCGAPLLVSRAGT